MLMELFLYIGPIAVIICIVAAIRGTKAKHIDDCPTWLKTNIYDNNGPDRPWGVK